MRHNGYLTRNGSNSSTWWGCNYPRSCWCGGASEESGRQSSLEQPNRSQWNGALPSGETPHRRQFFIADWVTVGIKFLPKKKKKKDRCSPCFCGGVESVRVTKILFLVIIFRPIVPSYSLGSPSKAPVCWNILFYASARLKWAAKLIILFNGLI